jgi:hypothetical protein
MAFSMLWVSQHKLFGWMSTYTGVAPVYKMAFGTTTHVNAGRITSSPGPIPMAFNTAYSPTLPFQYKEI